MKKILVVLLIFISLIPININAIKLNSKNVIMYNLNDDTVIYSLKPDEKVSIASMTKIMTCIVALENIKNLDEKVTMTSDMFKTLKEENAMVVGFQVGEEVTYRDLLYGLMLPSGADAAQGLAVSISDSIDKFVNLMNNKAKQLNLENTNFVNTTGFDNKNHYSTVSDVATILKYALKNNEFKKIFTANKYTSSNKKHKMVATRFGHGVDVSFIKGSKTGFTYDAGLCMASIADYNNVSYMLVTAKASYNNRTNHLVDAKNIYNYFFKNYSYRDILTTNELLTTINLNDSDIKYYNQENISKYLKNDCKLKKEYKEIKTNYEQLKLFDKIGEYVISCDDELLYTKDIYLNQIHINIEEKNNHIVVLVVGVIIICGGMILYGILHYRRNRKKVKRKKSR